MAELHILVVPNTPEIIERIDLHLRSAGFNPIYRLITNEATCKEALQDRTDVIVAAHVVSGFGASAVLSLLGQKGLSVPLIVVGERAGEQVAAMYGRSGAETYVPFDEMDQLGRAIHEALKHHDGGPEKSNANNLQGRVAELEAANADLRELDRRRAQYIYDVSHEFRNPITNLSMGLFLLQRDREHRTKHLINLKSEMDRLMNLLAHVLDLAQLDLNLEPLELKPVDLNSIVEQVIETHRSRAESDSLKVIFEAAPDLPLINADEQQLQQAISNVVINAINFTSTGEIHIATTSLPDQGHVALQIRDTGTGIPPAELPRVFERFFHGRALGRSGVRGTGLGLSIAQEIIQAHKGTIEIESEVGRGTTVRVLLPINSAV